MGLIDRLRSAIHSRTYSRAGRSSSDEPVPEMDPYVVGLVVAGGPRPAFTAEAAPYDYASWANVDGDTSDLADGTRTPHDADARPPDS